MAGTPDESIRAYQDEVKEAVEAEAPIIGVRNPQEYRGESPPADIPDTIEREGHIPGAENIPWGEAVNADGTFKPEEELREVYDEVADGDDSAVAYCRIGERSSVTWFVLNELLGLDAANYDGSWTEWADAKGAPVERPEPAKQPVTEGDDYQ
jgi:thiosulfate/3-mercaptopyruvate sulfurtransferase